MLHWLSRIFRRSRHAATCAAVTLGLVSAAGVGAVLAASPASALCGTTCVSPPPPTIPPPKTNHIAFTWALAQTQGFNMPNMDTTQESTTSPVSLNACGSTAAGGTSYPGISDYEWTFSNGNPEITTTSCTATWQRPLSKLATTVNVTLSIVPQSGSPFSLTQAVQYRDVVIASLGDSISSGEGAPDAGKNFSISGACDRSTLAGPAQAAVQAQQTLGSAVTVHFWFLACTGAGISYGLIGSYQPPSGPLLPPQLDRLSQLIGQSGLSVDRLQMTIGANDVYWGALLQACLPIGEYDPGSQTGCVNGYAWEINDALSELPGTFAGLQQKLAALVSPSKVYLTQYSDPLDSLSPQPGLCWGEPIAWQDLRQFGANTESSLQQIMQNASRAAGWQFIGGIQQAFQGHGVCQSSRATSPGGPGRWVNSAGDSNSTQGNYSGAWHPNDAGQVAIADIVYDYIISGL